jgi:hypothetical protein
MSLSCGNVWSSRLALSCANAAKFRVHPQVKRGQPTRPGPVRNCARRLRGNAGYAYPGPSPRQPRGGPKPNVNTDPAET